jgi:hypothetical protein
MAQSLVGYQLVDSNGSVVQSWGGVWGQYPSVPAVIALPNGNQVHCPALNVTLSGGYKIVAWMMDPPVPTPAEIAATALAAGLTIASAATPALDGTYDVSTKAQANITAVVTGVSAGFGLPGSGATFYYFDMSGAPHSFTAAQFVALATAIRDYVYALALYASGVAPLPAASVTIA